MAEIHSFIYGITADATVRKITVSRDRGATQSRSIRRTARMPCLSARLSSKTAYHWRRSSGYLTSTKRSKFRLISMRTPLGEKIRADIEVKAVARKEASG